MRRWLWWGVVLLWLHPHQHSLGQAQVRCPNAAPLRFAVIGDFGTGDANALAVAAQVRAWQPSFIISVGDNVYPDGSALETYQHNVQAVYGDWLPQPSAKTPRQRFWAVPGNHDWDASTRTGSTHTGQPLAAYQAFFGYPQGQHGFYYHLRLGALAFFFIDSDGREPAGVGRSSLQAQWLQAALAQSNAPWQVVVAHHPPYTSGKRGSNAYLQWQFAEWGADLLLTGHEHVYERLTVQGIPYVVNGLGGGYFGQFAPTALPESVARFAGEHGAMLGEVNAAGLQLRFESVAGATIDQFTLPCVR